MTITRVVCIGQVWPEPASSAAGSRLLQLLGACVGQDWQVTFACAAESGEHSADLAALGIASEAVALNCSSFDEWIADLQPDLVIFDRYLSEEQFGWRVSQVCPNALRVIDTEDLHSLRHARAQLLKRAGDGLPVNAEGETLYAAMASEDITLRELAAIYRSDLSLMISEAEIDLLQDAFGVPPALLHYVPFMVPGPTAEESLGFEQRQHFVTIGNFRHAPNWDSVQWLKSELWPAIRARVPGAQLHLYGAYVMPKATQLHNPREGFYIQGRAASATEVMRNARVCLAPLRFGAGLKGKLLDAMSTQTPSVTTTIGAEGMAPVDEWPGVVADSPVDFVEAAVSLYQNADHWHGAQGRCLPLLQKRFDQHLHIPALIDRLNHVHENLHNHRRTNIVGAMLNHHHHKSTQYMSQWIEAKTRHTQSTAPTNTPRRPD